MTDLDPRALEAAARALEEVQEQFTAECSIYIAMDHERFARAAVTAYIAEAGDGWMPIETAPKDGTKFLGYFGNVEFYRVTWWSNRQAAQHGSGWVFSQNGLAEPTHWRSLPAPPAAQDPRP